MEHHSNSHVTRAGRAARASMHTVFVTKYRREVFNGEIPTRCEAIMRGVCESFVAQLREFNGEGDHVHLLVHYPPKIALSTGIAGVREAAVCSVRRADGVTSLRAYVVAEPGVDRLATLATTIRSTTGAKLTSYKVPKDVEFIDALPRNSTGKILRRVLRGANRELPDGTA